MAAQSGNGFDFCGFTKWRQFSADTISCEKKGTAPLLNVFLHSSSAECWRFLGADDIPQGGSPFDRKKNLTSFQLYLFNEILTKCNKTDCKSRGEIDWIYQHPSVAMTSGDWHNGKQLPVGWIGNQFLTCFTQRFLTFEFYLTPFQPELWTCLLVWIVLIVSSLTIFTIYGGCATKSIVSAGTSGYKSFSPWFLVLSTIFEKSTPVPRKLQRKTFYRLVFGIWAVSAILFTNSYTGGMISTLNAPLPEVRMENWNHVIRDCDEAGMGVSAKTINILSWMNSTGISKYWEDVTSIEGLFEGILTPEILLLNPKHGRELKDLSERNKSKTTDEIDELIRKEVLKCGKTLWISGSDEVLSEYEYLLRNYPRNRWKKSRDMLTPISSRLMFERLDKSSVPKHFQSLIETGIWRRLEEEKRARDLSLRVAPAELEDILRQHPDIADVAVIGIPHEKLGGAPRAYVMPKAKN
ncbi:4-coumarate--CoA ligase-like 2 [Folsomia candida]|uniref:4-coumarate--CoA ligase-like 2 n=1 Tax=Folsomia candida TaxID=158441 RepID=A0A226DT42_FOLCA|nr:4-coumarate--CoA ligase-like 2 [Folsomia candida]